MITDLEKAVPADIIAAIAGVGSRDVMRVILAIHYIDRLTAVGLVDMLNIERLPATPSFPQGNMRLASADRDIDDALLYDLGRKIVDIDPLMDNLFRLRRFDDRLGVDCL